VLAAGGRIRDIGTRFDVYRQADRVSVTVLEGEVEVTWENGAAVQNVSPGQRFSYDRSSQPIELAQVDAEAVAAWREGRLVFKGESLGRVLEHLGRYHDVVLQTQDPKLRSLKVSGTFPTNDLKLALDAMAGALPIEITRIDARHVVLESVGKPTKR
jgi:transmembrane sensor